MMKLRIPSNELFKNRFPNLQLFHGMESDAIPELIGRRLDGDGDRHKEGHKEKRAMKLHRSES
jgi:hypothetical protein